MPDQVEDSMKKLLAIPITFACFCYFCELYPYKGLAPLILFALVPVLDNPEDLWLGDKLDKALPFIQFSSYYFYQSLAQLNSRVAIIEVLLMGLYAGYLLQPYWDASYLLEKFLQFIFFMLAVGLTTMASMGMLLYCRMIDNYLLPGGMRPRTYLQGIRWRLLSVLWSLTPYRAFTLPDSSSWHTIQVLILLMLLFAVFNLLLKIIIELYDYPLIRSLAILIKAVLMIATPLLTYAICFDSWTSYSLKLQSWTWLIELFRPVR